MKKIALSVLLGASLIITPSAFALTAMSDSNMKSATGQAGVSIALDDVTLYQSVGETLYTDTDGLGSDTDGAGIFVSGSETLTTIRAIFADEGDREGFLAHDYKAIYDANIDSTLALTPTAFTSKALTIDVANTVNVLTTGKKFNLTTYIAEHGGDVDGLTALGAELQEKGMKTVFNYAVTGAIDDYKEKFSGMLQLQGMDEATADATADGIIANAKAAVPLGYDGWLTALTDGGADVSSIALGIKGQTSWEGYATDLTENLAVAGIVIGLPTIEIRKTGSIKDIGIRSSGNDTTKNTYNDGFSFITIKKSDSTLAILDGFIEIAPH